MSPIKLVSTQRIALMNTLVEAFPDENALKQLVYTMGEDLARISQSLPVDEMVVNLIIWANSNDRLPELLEAAIALRTSNSDLKDLLAQLQPSAPTQSAPTTDSQATQVESPDNAQPAVTAEQVEHSPRASQVPPADTTSPSLSGEAEKPQANSANYSAGQPKEETSTGKGLFGNLVHELSSVAAGIPSWASIGSWASAEESAIQLLKDGRYEQAAEGFREALRMNPSDVGSAFNLGVALEKSEHYDEAIAAYRQAIAIQPTLADAYYNLGDLLTRLHRYDEAIVALKEAVRQAPTNANAYHDMALALKGLGRKEEAADAYTTAIKLNPNDAAAYNNIGNLFAEAGRVDEAEEAYRHGIGAKPDYAPTYYNLAKLLQTKGRASEGEDMLRKARELGFTPP